MCGKRSGCWASTPTSAAHVYGALDDYKTFSKAMVIERILGENQVEGESLLGFRRRLRGDPEHQGGRRHRRGRGQRRGRPQRKPDPWKRDRLIGAGADLVIPDYRDWRVLVDYLWSSR